MKLPDYNELMRTVKKEIALERKKAKEKKRRERLLRRKEKEEMLKAKKMARRAALREKSIKKHSLSSETKPLKTIFVKPNEKLKRRARRPGRSESGAMSRQALSK